MRKIFIISTFALFASCSSDDRTGREQESIIVKSGIGTTRGIQETSLVSGEKVYVWGFQEETAGSTDWNTNPYLKAWTLTADGSNGLDGSKRYYPPKSLSMVVIHGNFTYTEDADALPSSVNHTVETNQNISNNYEKSDLLYWKGQNKTIADNPIHLDFLHKLSKIEVTLESDYYTDSELYNAVVRLNNVKPTVTLTPSTGNLSSASGNVVSITPKRDNNSTTYEAVIPPQSAPSNFITVTLNGQTIIAEADASTFVSGEKYTYKVTIKLANPPLPLEYIATGNIKSISKNAQGQWQIDNSNGTNTSAYFTWTYFSTNFPRGSVCDDGNTYHAGSQGEWLSIFPSVPSSGGSGDRTSTWGGRQKTENNIEIAGITGLSFSSYWYQVSTGDIIGIRYISATNTNYCSAWRYTFTTGMTTIKAKRLDTPITDVSQVNNTNNALWTQIKSNDFWTTPDVIIREFPSCGFQRSGSTNMNPPGSNIYQRPGTGLYLINNSQVTNYYDEAIFESTYGTCYSSNFGNPEGGRSVRLFRDYLPY